jgi:outer membrane protein assembly factor BamE
MRYVFILLTVLLTACGTALPTVKPFKLDVQQGNVVTSKMLLQLRPGMTKSQVRFIMGTPLIQDSFHGNRWDYVYQMREAGKLTEQRRVILDFENELLKTVRGDVIASKGEQAKADAEGANIGTRVVEPPVKAEEKSFLDKLKFWGKDEAELAKEAADIKAKAAAESVKKAAPVVPLSPAADNTVPAAPSALAVPLEVSPALEAADTPSLLAPIVVPEATPLLPAATPALMAVPLVVPMPTVEPAVDSVAAPAAVPVPALEKTPPPEKEPVYESSSGMRFDRTLKFSIDEAEPVVTPKTVAPRVGNKTVPSPKELPAETEPGMFDRMLEKIGF